METPSESSGWLHIATGIVLAIFGWLMRRFISTTDTTIAELKTEIKHLTERIDGQGEHYTKRMSEAESKIAVIQDRQTRKR